MTEDTLATLIEASDLAGLLKRIDGMCSHRAWDDLIDLRDRCEEAVERGKQVWAVAQFAEYRLALEAPAPIAASVLSDGRGRFALGPLWEVAASTHDWVDLDPHITVPTLRAMVAHERSIRAEAVDGSTIDPHILQIPVAIQPWEPSYPVADYRSDRAAFPDDVFDTPMEWTDLPETPMQADPDDALCDALLDLVKPWWEDSQGKAEVVTVEGSVEEAIRTLGPSRVRLADVDLATFMAAASWAAASGGGHGRRRGTPAGRAAAWWVLLEALGYDDIPDHPGTIGEEASELRWVLWDPGDRIGGWNLHVGIEDPESGLAWVLSAVDAV